MEQYKVVGFVTCDGEIMDIVTNEFEKGQSKILFYDAGLVGPSCMCGFDEYQLQAIDKTTSNGGLTKNYIEARGLFKAQAKGVGEAYIFLDNNGLYIVKEILGTSVNILTFCNENGKYEKFACENDIEYCMAEDMIELEDEPELCDILGIF